MSGSLLARGLLVSLALAILVAPAAFADEPGTTTTTTETTATTTTEPTTTDATTSDTSTTTSTEPTTTTGETAPTAPTLTDGSAPALPWAETPTTRRLLARAVHYRSIARRWRALMSRPRPVLHRRSTPFESLLEKRRWKARRWYAKAIRARRAGHHPPHRSAWECIHRWEGSWRDPNPPYYGGLQMDLTFQRTYAPRLLRRRGTADHWRPLAQMWVAERALRAGRGFYPWPVSAWRCGLI
jgi:hypothetical protein